MPDFDFIDDASGVARAAAALEGADIVAVDTEFVREKTYFPRWCLTQFAVADGVFVVDVLDDAVALRLAEVLASPTLTKVFHSARQDLEVFARASRAPVAPLFDTQVAAALVGYPEQVGYAALVKSLLGVELPKDVTRTDWSRRPLSPRQLEYAANDVRYLYRLHPVLVAELERRGRLDWALEDCARVVDGFDVEALYGVEDAVQRVKGVNRLDRRALAAAERIARWREGAAQSRDRPRRWVLDDRDLVEISLACAEGRLAASPEASRLNEDYRAALMDIEADVLALEEGMLPSAADFGPPSPSERRAVKRLAAIVAERASALGIEASVLAKRRDLEAAVRGDFTGLPFTGWRDAEVGEALRGAAS